MNPPELTFEVLCELHNEYQESPQVAGAVKAIINMGEIWSDVAIDLIDEQEQDIKRVCESEQTLKYCGPSYIEYHVTTNLSYHPDRPNWDEKLYNALLAYVPAFVIHRIGTDLLKERNEES